PALRARGPIKLVAKIDALVRIEMKPALAARLARPRIPRDGEGLESAAGQLDEILLQRPHAERVLDLEVGRRAVGPFRPDHEPALAAKERGGGGTLREAANGEAPDHRPPARRLHRPRVIRFRPPRVLLRVARSARLRADEGGGRSRRGRGGRSQVAPGQQRGRYEQDQTARDEDGRSQAIQGLKAEGGARSSR